MSFQPAPARAGRTDEDEITKHAENATKPASRQADKSRAFAGEVSKESSVVESEITQSQDGLDLADNAASIVGTEDELINQLNAEVSGTHIGPGMCSEEIISIRGVIHAVKSGFFREQIENLRGIFEECGGDKNHPDFKSEKLKLDSVVIAGKIEGEIARAWERGDFEPSGFLQIDIDDLADAEMVREELRAINYILSSFVSPSGDGVKAIAYIGKSRDANDFKNRFQAVEKDMARRGHIIDTTCKNPNRLMFASWDADAWTRNSAAIPLKFPKNSLPPAKAKETKPISKSVETPDNVPVSQKLVKQLKAKSPMARNLYETGDWEKHSFPSQSEADFSLGCTICEISDDPALQEALFRASALYRNDRKLTLALAAARLRVAKDAALPTSNFGSEQDEVESSSIVIWGVNSYPTTVPPETVILGRSWLRRGDIGNLVSSAGSGKSVGATQAAMAWGLGIPYFGIKPPRPLRILLFSGEDDGVTIGQCREGFLKHSQAITGRQLTAVDLEPLDKILRTEFSREHVGGKFHSHLAGCLTESPVDLVIINPLLSYIGGEIVACASEWLRAGLMPILQKHKCAALVIHHTPKLMKGSWDAMDDTYSGIGGGEIANIPRSILTLKPTPAHGLFVLTVAKRQTTGWKDSSGKFCTNYFVKRSGDPEQPAWIPVSWAEAEDLIGGAGIFKQSSGRKKANPADVVRLLECERELSRQSLIAAIMESCKCSDRPARDAISAAETADLICSSSKPSKTGGKPEKWFHLSTIQING